MHLKYTFEFLLDSKCVYDLFFGSIENSIYLCLGLGPLHRIKTIYTFSVDVYSKIFFFVPNLLFSYFTVNVCFSFKTLYLSCEICLKYPKTRPSYKMCIRVHMRNDEAIVFRNEETQRIIAPRVVVRYYNKNVRCPQLKIPVVGLYRVCGRW